MFSILGSYLFNGALYKFLINWFDKKWDEIYKEAGFSEGICDIKADLYDKYIPPRFHLRKGMKPDEVERIAWAYGAFFDIFQNFVLGRPISKEDYKILNDEMKVLTGETIDEWLK